MSVNDLSLSSYTISFLQRILFLSFIGLFFCLQKLSLLFLTTFKYSHCKFFDVGIKPRVMRTLGQCPTYLDAVPGSLRKYKSTLGEGEKHLFYTFHYHHVPSSPRYNQHQQHAKIFQYLCYESTCVQTFTHSYFCKTKLMKLF